MKKTFSLLLVFMYSCSLLKPKVEIKEIHSRDSIYTKEMIYKDTILPKMVVTDTIRLTDIKYYPQYKYITKSDGDLVELKYMLDSMGNLIIDCQKNNQALTTSIINTTTSTNNKNDVQPVKIINKLNFIQKLLLYIAGIIVLFFLLRLVIYKIFG